MIKEQCDSCKKQNSTCKEFVEFDNSSCASYEKKGIDLDKHDDKTSEETVTTQSPFLFDKREANHDEADEFAYTREYLKENTDISGWLLLFCWLVVVGGFISFVYPLLTFKLEDYSGSYLLGMADIVPGLLLFMLAIMTITALGKREPDAIFLAKTYLIVCFADNLLGLFIGDIEENTINSMPKMIRSLIWCVIWFLYLVKSNQVKEVIPIEYRKSFPRDWYMVAALVISPLFFLACGIYDVNNMAENDNKNREMAELELIKNTTLQNNEFTDGRIIFKKDDMFICNDTVVDQLKLFYLEGDNCSVTLCSDYEPDHSNAILEFYWNNWEDETIKSNSPQIVAEEIHKINGNTFFYKVKKYEVNGSTIFWRFGMLFDISSTKVCIISSYDNGIDNYYTPLVESIRFQ